MAGMVLSSSAFAQVGSGSCHQSTLGCDLSRCSKSSDQLRLATNDRPGYPPLSGYQDPYCKDGQCNINFGKPRNNCDTENCEIGLRHENHGSGSFPYVSEREVATGRTRRLDERLKPEYQTSPSNSNRERRESHPVSNRYRPTGFEMQGAIARTISWNTDIRRAANLANQENRPILIQISAPWCSHCERMKNETYTDPNLMDLISQRFVAIAVNADDQKDFVRQMGIQSLPTTLIVAPDLRILNRRHGFQSAQQLMQTLSR